MKEFIKAWFSRNEDQAFFVLCQISHEAGIGVGYPKTCVLRFFERTKKDRKVERRWEKVSVSLKNKLSGGEGVNTSRSIGYMERLIQGGDEIPNL